MPAGTSRTGRLPRPCERDRGRAEWDVSRIHGRRRIGHRHVHEALLEVGACRARHFHVCVHRATLLPTLRHCWRSSGLADQLNAVLPRHSPHPCMPPVGEVVAGLSMSYAASRARGDRRWTWPTNCAKALALIVPRLRRHARGRPAPAVNVVVAGRDFRRGRRVVDNRLESWTLGCTASHGGRHG